MENKKSLLIYYILISFLIQSFLSIDDPIITPDQPYNTKYENINSEQNLTIKIENLTSSPLPYDEDNIYYVHFTTDPISAQNQDLQQIIFSPEIDKLSTNDSDSYSFRFSRNANLITVISNETNQIFLTIKCFEYPCSFNFKAAIEVNKANLYLDEMHNFYAYNSNSFGKEKFNKVKFNIPGIKNVGKNNLMIAIINPGDPDGSYAKLDIRGVPSYKKYKINMGVVYVIDEETDVDYYELEIESLENQFITISIKTSNFGSNYYESEITPNTIAKFSDLRVENEKINECFRVNQNYIQNFIDNTENSFLFASIDFFSPPIKSYLKYSNSQKPIDNDNSQNSLNFILSKESNEYPQICFETDNLNFADNTYMLEISHMYPGMENIDIFSPIFSGFFTTKILPKNYLGLYSHYSDVHFLKKISFYLKPIKGNPEMYFVQCDTYPNCYNKITDLQNNPTKAFKAINYGNFQFYSKKYDYLTKDLSPSSPSQNLLYVHCPPDSEEDFCQYQILIYSDSEEIVLNQEEDFFVAAEKDEELMFKLSLKKGQVAPRKIGFCFNVTLDEIYFDTLEDFNNATISMVKEESGMICYRYEPDKRFNDLSRNDIDIVFNIRALKDVNFVLKNNFIYLKTNMIGEIINLPDFSFPFDTNFLINNANSDLIFNLYLNDKKYQGLNLTKVEIGYTILNFTYATEIQEQEIKILEGSIIEKLDAATRSCVIRISKEYIKEIVKDDNETQYYLHLVIVNNDASTNDNKNIRAKMFILEKGANNKIFLDNDMFISDKFTLGNNNLFNLYHLKTNSKELLEIKFTSNYPLDDKFLVYILEYNNTNIDIDYIEQNKKSYTISSIGQIYTLLFNCSSSDLIGADILIAVVSKLDKNSIKLQTINYIFKYNLYTHDKEYNNRAKYEFNENYNLTKQKDKYTIEFSPIKKGNTVLKDNEIYIRRILDNKKISEESFATFAKIESENELIKIDKKEEKDDKTVITFTSTEKENCSYSILIDNLKENEKFLISNKTEIVIPPDPDDSTTDEGGDTTDGGKKPEGENEGDGDNSLVLKIVIPIVVVVVVVAVILIIITIKKRKGRELNMKILKTSFQEGERNLLQENYVNSEEY